MEAFNRTGGSGSSEVQARRERLQFDLWKVLDEFLYRENVRASSKGVDMDSDPDDVGVADGGGDVYDMEP